MVSEVMNQDDIFYSRFIDNKTPGYLSSYGWSCCYGGHTLALTSYVAFIIPLLQVCVIIRGSDGNMWLVVAILQDF
jgi:hypothetical protein